MNADEMPCAVLPGWEKHDEFYDSLKQDFRSKSLQKLKKEGYAKQFVDNCMKDLERLDDMNVSKAELFEFFNECLYKHLDRFAVIQLRIYANLEAIIRHLEVDHDMSRQEAIEVMREINGI